MRALSKLVNLNHPDLVLFVGEALAGNDAVDQVNMCSPTADRLAHGSMAAASSSLVGHDAITTRSLHRACQP